MIDPNNREMMSRLYRLIEKYEKPPRIEYQDDAVDYFTEVLNDIKKIDEDFPNSVFAKRFTVALYAAVEDGFKMVNKAPFKEKPEQQTLLYD